MNIALKDLPNDNKILDVKKSSNGLKKGKKFLNQCVIYQR